MKITLCSLDSPLGTVSFATTEGGLCALELGLTPSELQARIARSHPSAEFQHAALPEFASALRAYFAGELGAIDALPVALMTGTEFQRQVWAALRRIPVGTTWTYARLAREVGRPKAVRAVGAANGANPVALVVPCHRVVATGGELGGYAGGLEKKAWLLQHERARLA